MMSFVNLPTVGGELRAIKYEAACVRHSSPNDKYPIEIPAHVSFRLGDVWVVLTVEDARDLLEALPGVLAQHPDGEAVESPKAVA
ncbi:hypothetical protein [Nocardia sp. NPDC051981]|uniref:hypothetical protein n=1 Tax=Nocardia sp. NPDC051981 TaxID=3155417 RepID=UPI003432EC7C